MKVTYNIWSVFWTVYVNIYANESKVMVFEWNRSELVDIVCLYRVGHAYQKECKSILNSKELEEVNESKYLGLVV